MPDPVKTYLDGQDIEPDAELESLDWTGDAQDPALAPGMDSGDAQDPATDAQDQAEDPFGGAGAPIQDSPEPVPQTRPKPNKPTRKAAAKIRRGGHTQPKPSTRISERQGGDYAEQAAFPLPPTRHFKDENNRADCKGNGFFQFWSRVAEGGFQRRIMVYVYRIWPVMREGYRQAGKLTEPITMDDLVRLYGVGDYNLKFNDAGNRYATICQCTIKNIGDRNMTEHPPMLDTAGLEMEDPLNGSYMRFLKARGEFKTEGSGDDMANTDIVREVVSSNRRLTDKLIERSERSEQERRSDERPIDIDSAASMRGMDIVQQAAIRSQEMINSTVERVQTMSQAQGDPMGMIDKTFTLVRSVLPQPGQGADSQVVEVMKLMMERDKGYYDRLFQMQQGQIQSLENLLKAQPQNQPQTPERPKTLMEQISEIGMVKDKLRDIMGLDGEDKETKGGGWTDHIPAILQGVALLGTVLVSASHNLAVARTGQGTPVHPPLPENVLTQEQQLAAQAGESAGLSGQTGMGGRGQDQGPPAQPLANQFAQAQAEAAKAAILKQEGGLQTMAQFHGFFKMIQVPLLRSFQEGDNGAEFASKLIELADNGFFGNDTGGQQIYGMVTQYGIALVGMTIKTYPPIWNVVSLTPGKWDQFLSEFFKAPEIWEKEDREDEAEALREREEASRQAQAQARPQSRAVQTATQTVPVAVVDGLQEAPGSLGAPAGVQTTGQGPTASPGQAQPSGGQPQGKRPRR
jgi:hypothetical protein